MPDVETGGTVSYSRVHGKVVIVVVEPLGPGVMSHERISPVKVLLQFRLERVVVVPSIVAEIQHLDNIGIKAVKTSPCGRCETPIAWENTPLTKLAITVIRARRWRDETLQ